jgi:hypothetical protein
VTPSHLKPQFDRVLAPFKSRHHDNQIALLSKTVVSESFSGTIHESYGTRRVGFSRDMDAIFPQT